MTKAGPAIAALATTKPMFWRATSFRGKDTSLYPFLDILPTVLNDGHQRS
jgi:hypothetical protein